MDFSLIRSFDELDFSPSHWNDLLGESVNDLPFLRWEYLRAWWETHGGGEWPQAELVLVVARQADRLVGIAPLFSAVNREGLPSLLLLGSIEVSDYLDVIVRPADLSDFLSGLLDFLASSPAVPAWQCLDWHNLLETSPTLPALKALAESRGWSFLQERTYHAPAITLPGDFESYLCSIDKKQRHEIRRKMRRAVEAGNVRWYIANDPLTLEAELEAFLVLMTNEPTKAAFLTEPMRRHMHLSSRAAFENGWLQLAFLEVDGQKAAGYINFDYRDSIWVYNSGLDRRFVELSPGWVLLGDLLEWANEQHRRLFDFLRGEEQYKYRFGGVDRFVARARVTRS